MPMYLGSFREIRTNRWAQLVLGIICMASVANLQYGWTLFVLPIQDQWGWTKAENSGGFHDIHFVGDLAGAI